MKKFGIFALILVTCIPAAPASGASENTITPYTFSNEYFSMSISLENLSRPTFQLLNGVKSPIFVPGDNVAYAVSFKPNRDYLWAKVNELMTKQFGTKYKTNDAKLHLALGLKYGDEEGIDISETYQYQPDKFLENRLKGVMVVPAKKNLILTWAGIDIHSLVQSVSNTQTKTGSTQKLGPVVSIELDVIDVASNQVVFLDTSKTPQAIDPLTVGSLSISNQFIQLTTKSSSNLPISGISSTSSTCSYISGVIALKKPGNCLVILTQPGNEVYAAAKPLVVSFKITPTAKKVKLCSTSSRILQVPSNKTCPIL